MNTVLIGHPAPIFARTMCLPRGVHSLPNCSPAPLLAVAVEYVKHSFLLSSLKTSVCELILISILDILPASPRKKFFE